jgi:energy-coupling factor transporter ATP-binding protein EcfA2
VPEEANLYPHLTDWEYLEMVGTLREISENSLATKADQLLDLLALGANKHVQMSAYSKGMRQRILFIAALMDNPDVLVLDEPLSGLDVTSAMVVKNLIQMLSSRGKFIFYCSHMLEVVEKVCTQLIVLRKTTGPNPFLLFIPPFLLFLLGARQAKAQLAQAGTQATSPGGRDATRPQMLGIRSKSSRTPNQYTGQKH